MNVTAAVRARHSTRAFLPKPVPMDSLRDALALAAHAPSGGNLQPWRIHVLSDDALAIERADKPARLGQFAKNYDFFGAPVGLFCFVDRRLGPPQWSDLGMYLQTLMLLLAERGIATCAQEAWSAYGPTVQKFVNA